MEDIRKFKAKLKELYSNSKYSEIVGILNDELLLKYNDSDLFILRGVAFMALTQADKAILDYNKAIAINANSATAFFDRGLAWVAIKEYDKALTDYSRAIELKKDYINAYINRGLAWKHKGENEKAISDFDKAIELKNDDYTSYFHRASLFAKINQNDKAISDYDKSIKFNKDDSSPYNNRGILYAAKGDYDKAIVDYNKSIELHKDNYLAYNNRGLSFVLKGEIDKAVNDFDSAIKINPNYGNGYRNKGDIFFNRGNYIKAIELFEKAIEVDSKYSFLEYKIKLANEKLEEIRALDASKAEQKHKNEKRKLEKQIQTIINKIREISKSDVKTVVHYTKIIVADIYVKKLGVKMNYSNAIYMNDPMEGKIFFDYINDKAIEQAYENGEKRTETSVYLGSFLPADEKHGETSHEDELVMWRTYGKDENGNEAAGCNIVLNSNFFKTSEINSVDLESQNSYKEELLNVVYIKKSNLEDRIANDSKGEIKLAIDELKLQLSKMIRLRDKYDSKLDFYKEIENTIFKQLSTISYLFKSADYQFENEVRVITYMPRDSDLIKVREIISPNAPSKRFYIESYNDILPFIEKIYLGPKVEHYQQWSLYFDYEIRQRVKDLLKNPDIKYQIKPANIEIIKSICKFQ